jgi:hypothetical protein
MKRFVYLAFILNVDDDKIKGKGLGLEGEWPYRIARREKCEFKAQTMKPKLVAYFNSNIIA